MTVRMVQARLSLALVGTFLGLLGTLHVLEPEYNSGHLISEYQLSRHGWMMSLAFWCLSLAAMLEAHRIPRPLQTRSGQFGSGGLWLPDVAFFAAGFFPPIQTRPIVAYVHGVSGLVVILGAPIVFLLVSVALAHVRAWACTSPHVWWATALAWVGMLSFLGFTASFASRTVADPAMVLHPTITISNRVMIVTYCLWFAVAAWAPARRAS